MLIFHWTEVVLINHNLARKFVPRGSTPRPGSRVASATLGHHHKPFGSARIARTPRALELVGACPRLVALDPRWQRQQESRRGWAIDTRLAPGACSEVPERPRIDATISQRQPCGPGTAHRPGRHRTRLRAARWWPPRRGSRLPATLAPDGDASRTQQSHPSATATLGTRTARPCAVVTQGRRGHLAAGSRRKAPTTNLRVPDLHGAIS